MNGTVYILTPVHNRVKTTLEFVDRLLEQTHNNFRLILVDDGSSDGTSAAVARKMPEAKVIKGDGNLWWAGSLQLCFEWLQDQAISSSDIVLIINDDTVFDERFIERGVKLLRQKSDSLLIAECFHKESGELFDRGLFFDEQTSETRCSNDNSETNCASTRGLFVNAVDFITIGGFYPRLLPHYLSDYEFAIRASKMGFHIFSDPSVKVWTSGTESGVCDFHGMSFWEALMTMLFEKRYRRNVLFSSVFIVLTCRWYCTPKIVFRVWIDELGLLFRVLPDPVYRAVHLVALPIFHLMRAIYVFISFVISRTFRSLRLISRLMDIGK